ncbi:hypothetical protein DY000_02002097 [Brassica cretica]|uniref:NYN domain-containing protein n=1 Tax=Brassica cretica TaxID=69181 RepID=A0ABQ7CGY7_BRACR|nr:hypothetical protein DY000_02002097 [Brassica cretica]
MFVSLDVLNFKEFMYVNWICMANPRFTEMMSDPQFTYKPVPTPVVIYESTGFTNAHALMFDAEDFSIPNPHVLKENILTAIKKEGYRGRIKIKGYFGDKKTIPQELLDKYLEAGIYSKIFEGDRVARMNMMLVELLFWAMTHYPHNH